MTNKVGRTVQFESFGEQTWVLQLDRNSSVRDLGSQPEVFIYRDLQGKEHTYIPDFIVWWANGDVEIHEVTRTERADRRDQRQRQEAGARICQERHWRYVVHTEKTLPSGAERANLLALLSYRPSAYYHPQVTEALAHFDLEQPLPLQTLGARIAQDQDLPLGIVYAALCHLIWHDELSTNWQSLLFIDAAPTAAACVWRAPRKDE